MDVLILAFAGMLICVSAMAVGVIFGRQPIKGSCGGLAALGMGECEICGGDPARCEAPAAGPRQNSAENWYEATAKAGRTLRS